MPEIVCTCLVVTHVAIGLVFQAGTHREIQRSPDCPMHRCGACLGEGWVCEAHPDRVWEGNDNPACCKCGAPGMVCVACQGAGVKA